MLSLRKVEAGYGANRVINGVDLDIGAGTTIALLGPNGTGKTTLIKAIGGLLPDCQGEIRLDDNNLVGLQTHRIVARGLAVVPEGRLIFAPLSVADNLRLGAIPLTRGGGSSLAERYEYVFGLFPRLAERRTQIAGTLSGGEQQMLAIGRALMGAPRLLLLDEPFLGLAPMIVDEIRAALDRLRQQGMTQLLVEQKIDVALDLASEAHVMIKGRIVLSEATATLRRRGDLAELYLALAREVA